MGGGGGGGPKQNKKMECPVCRQLCLSACNLVSVIVLYKQLSREHEFRGAVRVTIYLTL